MVATVSGGGDSFTASTGLTQDEIIESLIKSHEFDSSKIDELEVQA